MLANLVKNVGMRGRVGCINFHRSLSAATIGLGSDIPGHTLDDIMKTDLLKDAPADQVTKIWTEYHAKKEGFVSAVVPSLHYAEIEAKGKLCPRFIFAVPKDTGGFDMVYSEIHQHRISFTSLEAFKAMNAAAPPLLELFHYVDFQKDKEIVLMRGAYKDPVTSAEAVFLVNQLQMYYRIDPERFKLVHTFNHNPMFFDFNELITNLDNPDMKKPAVETEQTSQ